MSCYIPASSLYCCRDNSTNAGGPPAWCQESEALSHTTPSSSFHLAGPQPLWGDCSEAAYHRWEALHQKPRGLVGRELGRPYQLTTRGRWAPGIHTSTCACLASVNGSLPFPAGYRESAAFLQRAADQLEAMLAKDSTSSV